MMTPTHVVIAGVLILIFSAAEYLLTRRAGWLGLVLPLVVTVMGILLEKIILFLLIPLILFFLLALQVSANKRRRKGYPAKGYRA